MTLTLSWQIISDTAVYVIISSVLIIKKLIEFALLQKFAVSVNGFVASGYRVMIQRSIGLLDLFEYQNR